MPDLHPSARRHYRRDRLDDDAVRYAAAHVLSSRPNISRELRGSGADGLLVAALVEGVRPPEARFEELEEVVVGGLRAVPDAKPCLHGVLSCGDVPEPCPDPGLRGRMGQDRSEPFPLRPGRPRGVLGCGGYLGVAQALARLVREGSARAGHWPHC